MTLPVLLLTNLAILAVVSLAIWALSLVLRDASIIDSFWGLGFVLVAWLSLLLTGAEFPVTILVTAMVTVWGVRLSGYLTWRNWGKPEDHRYAAMRQKHGDRYPVVSLFTVFGLQAALVWVISLPIQVGIAGGEGWRWWTWLGAALWVVGLLFESIGDYQLARFKSDPANQGRVMNRGLWRYTRHPNYFGDFLVWWGFYLVAALPGSWWWTLIGPVLMSFLLLRVSGVRLLESSLKSRVDGYEEYTRRTSPFFPMPPGKHPG